MAGWGGEEAQVLSYSAPEEEVFIGKDVRAFVGAQPPPTPTATLPLVAIAKRHARISQGAATGETS
jgi:hypothetical protein